MLLWNNCTTIKHIKHDHLSTIIVEPAQLDPTLSPFAVKIVTVVHCAIYKLHEHRTILIFLLCSTLTWWSSWHDNCQRKDTDKWVNTTIVVTKNELASGVWRTVLRNCMYVSSVICSCDIQWHLMIFRYKRMQFKWIIDILWSVASWQIDVCTGKGFLLQMHPKWYHIRATEC